MSTPFIIFFLDNPNSTYHTTYKPTARRLGLFPTLYPPKADSPRCDGMDWWARFELAYLDLQSNT